MNLLIWGGVIALMILSFLSRPTLRGRRDGHIPVIISVSLSALIIGAIWVWHALFG